MDHYSNTYEVKRECHIQKRLLSLSQFLSYFPFMKFLTGLVGTISINCTEYLETLQQCV